ncbi:Prd1-proteinase yscd [Pleurostoma richardsiae]|uniref:Prd1-proteinase yscd n=1 Tax=Pleurostoma richardsiae TaxID=41990 RepID=A0AA38RVT5_9PEZI|nr:Prd1-proteinase yscd [Pleurostoma richardsiae]
MSRPEHPRSAPEPPPTFEETPATLLAETASVLAKSANLRDHLVATLTPENATFSNLIVPLVDDGNLAACRLRPLTLLASVSPDPALREAARAAEKQIAAADSANLARADVAVLVAAVYEMYYDNSEVAAHGEAQTCAGKNENSRVSLDDQDLHLLARMHGESVRHGAGLRDEVSRARFKEASSDLQELLVAARKTLSETGDGVWFTPAELAGVPPRTLETMKRSATGADAKEPEASLWVTFRKSHYTAVMRNATRAETRKRLYMAKGRRFPENVERLARIVVLRTEIARLLGFANHAEFKNKEMMADSVDEVRMGLEQLRDRLRPLAKQEIDKLLAIKYELMHSDGHETSNDTQKLYFWDWSFYDQLSKKRNWGFNGQKLSEYFEVEHTVKRMLELFEELLGINFETTVRSSVWHEDVEVYTVWNDATEGREFLGHLYLDLFAREGKYEGAHHALIRPGFTEGNKHSEVRTVFHELGHAIHNILALTKYAIPHSRDFMEIPSIMLENWIWVPQVLRCLGKHYTFLEEYRTAPNSNSTDETDELTIDELLPEKLAKDVCRTKHLNGAHDLLTQIHAALFDLAIHSPVTHAEAAEMNITRVWNALHQEIVGLSFDGEQESDSEVRYGQAGFPHVYRKNDAGYFAYVTSQICATDMYVTAFKDDPLSHSTWRKYKYFVLQPGSGQLEAITLKGFLGRKPNSEALFHELLRRYMHAYDHLRSQGDRQTILGAGHLLEIPAADPDHGLSRQFLSAERPYNMAPTSRMPMRVWACGISPVLAVCAEKVAANVKKRFKTLVLVDNPYCQLTVSATLKRFGFRVLNIAAFMTSSE